MESMMTIRIGDIVTVIFECLFTGNQGVVVEIVDDDDEDGPIGVRFGSEYRESLGILWEEQNVTRFLETDLRVESSWSTATLAKRLYRSCHHTVYELKYPFVLGCDCMIRGCPHKASMRGVVNIWGTVCPLDLCEDHTEEYHGKLGESLPDLQFPEETAVAM